MVITLNWFILAPASIAMSLLAIILSPVVALFVRKDGTLPRLLLWFGTPDNPNFGAAQSAVWTI